MTHSPFLTDVQTIIVIIKVVSQHVEPLRPVAELLGD